jgi:formamidopyrimidine-DNA glycosylase
LPELPEVEVTRRQLRTVLCGRRIRAVHAAGTGQFFMTKPRTLRQKLMDRTVERLGRHGKYLIGELDDGSRLVLHLGMTGQLFTTDSADPSVSYRARGAERAPAERRAPALDVHTHLRIEFDDGGPEVRFRDIRKFGRVLLLGPGQRDPRLDKLGVDALAARGEQLFVASRKRRAAIKTLLLNQSVLAGVGNIYADEALHQCGIRPTRVAGRLNRADCEQLVSVLRAVMRDSIRRGGTTVSDFINPEGRDGSFQRRLRVYAREGEPCGTCGTEIRRIVLGQRSSHFCPKCQRR